MSGLARFMSAGKNNANACHDEFRCGADVPTGMMRGVVLNIESNVDN